MANEVFSPTSDRKGNLVGGVSSAEDGSQIVLRLDPSTKRLLVSATFDIDAVEDGDVVAAGTTGFLALGTDGTNYQVISVNTGGRLQIDAISIPGIVGTIADDATTPGNPVMVGGMAKSPDGTTPTAVAENDVARFITDLNRRHFVNTRSPQWWSFHSDGSSALTDSSVQADPGDGFEIVITEIIFSTGAATACNIFFEEGSTKVLGPWYLEAVAGRGLVWRGEKHITASTAVTVTTSAAIAQSIDIQGYIQAV